MSIKCLILGFFFLIRLNGGNLNLFQNKLDKGVFISLIILREVLFRDSWLSGTH